MENKDFSFTIDGFEEIIKILDEIPSELKDTVQLQINKQAGNVARKEVLASIPQGYRLKGVKVVKSNTPSGIFLGWSPKVFWIRFIEYGTRIRQTRKGYNRGVMTPRPFVDRSYTAAIPKMLDFLKENYLRVLNNAIKKQLKKIKSRHE